MSDEEAKKKIVLIDDSLELLWITSLVLERRGYDVLALRDCEDLLERIRIFKPGVIFMDHLTAGITGLEATRLVKTDPVCRHIPVVYLSAQENVRQLARDAGAEDWLSKPFRLEEFRNKADKYFRGKGGG